MNGPDIVVRSVSFDALQPVYKCIGNHPLYFPFCRHHNVADWHSGRKTMRTPSGKFISWAYRVRRRHKRLIKGSGDGLNITAAFTRFKIHRVLIAGVIYIKCRRSIGMDGGGRHDVGRRKASVRLGGCSDCRIRRAGEMSNPCQGVTISVNVFLVMVYCVGSVCFWNIIYIVCHILIHCCGVDLLICNKRLVAHDVWTFDRLA